MSYHTFVRVGDLLFNACVCVCVCACVRVWLCEREISLAFIASFGSFSLRFIVLQCVTMCCSVFIVLQ